MNVTAERAVYKSAECPQASGWGVATLAPCEIIAKQVKARGGKGRDLTRRMLYLPALIVAAMLLACAVALLALSEIAEATSPSKNGRIAYVSYGGNNSGIYTINPDGGGKPNVTEGSSPSYSSNGKRIAYIVGGGNDTEIYINNVGGGGKTPVTNNNRDDFTPSYSPDGKKIAYMGYTGLEGDDRPLDAIIYTIKVGGGKSQVTNTKYCASEPSWGSRQ